MPGTVAGSGVSNITWANGFPPPMAAVSTVNPTPLWQATFTAPASPGAVQLTLTPEGPHAVWASFGSFLATEVISLNTAGAAATIVVGTPCYPDCTEDGALTVADFGCFQTRFAAGNPYADCNADGSLTVADFGCFQTQFVAGCP
jgi:hypothetical protein